MIPFNFSCSLISSSSRRSTLKEVQWQLRYFNVRSYPHGNSFWPLTWRGHPQSTVPHGHSLPENSFVEGNHSRKSMKIDLKNQLFGCLLVFDKLCQRILLSWRKARSSRKWSRVLTSYSCACLASILIVICFPSEHEAQTVFVVVDKQLYHVETGECKTFSRKMCKK